MKSRKEDESRRCGGGWGWGRGWGGVGWLFRLVEVCEETSCVDMGITIEPEAESKILL